MLRLIGLLVLLATGFAGGIGWEARPSIGWHLNLLIWHPGFSLPDGLKGQRDKALRALQIAQDGETRCRAAIGAQNASIASLAEKSTAALAKSKHDVEAARAVAESLRRSSADLGAYVPKGADRCERWDDADRAVLESLK